MGTHVLQIFCYIFHIQIKQNFSENQCQPSISFYLSSPGLQWNWSLFQLLQGKRLDTQWRENRFVFLLLKFQIFEFFFLFCFCTLCYSVNKSLIGISLHVYCICTGLITYVYLCIQSGLLRLAKSFIWSSLVFFDLICYICYFQGFVSSSVLPIAMQNCTHLQATWSVLSFALSITELTPPRCQLLYFDSAAVKSIQKRGE